MMTDEKIVLILVAIAVVIMLYIITESGEK